MNISKKWSAATAALLALALVGGGTTAANAAQGDIPESAGQIWLWDGDTGEAREPGPTTTYERMQSLLISGSATDIAAEIVRPAAAAGATQAYRFVAKKEQLWNGTNTWQAYGDSALTGPTGGVVYDNFTLGNKGYGNSGGIDKVFADGGDWVAGIAFTTNNGVTPLASIYREINVNAATGKVTIKPYPAGPVVEGPTVTTQPTSQSVTVGADAVFTAAASGSPAPTVKWESSTDGTTWANVSSGITSESPTAPATTSSKLTVPAATIAQSGTQYRAVFTNPTSAATATSNPVQLTVVYSTDGPPTDAAKKVTIADPAAGTSVITINAGVANKDKLVKVLGWSTPTVLPSVTTDASGVATVDAAALGNGPHTVALVEPGNNALIAWGTVNLVLDDRESETQLTAVVTTSEKFALEGVNAGPVALGTAKRGATTTPVALGAFTVTDDRDLLKGWTLTAGVSTFKNAANEEIPGNALGFEAKKVGDPVAGITAAAKKAAGDAWTSTVVAEGAPLSTTLEAGTQFDAFLSFKAPADAKKGTYTSTLTLTLASK